MADLGAILVENLEDANIEVLLNGWEILYKDLHKKCKSVSEMWVEDCLNQGRLVTSYFMYHPSNYRTREMFGIYLETEEENEDPYDGEFVTTSKDNEQIDGEIEEIGEIGEIDEIEEGDTDDIADASRVKKHSKVLNKKKSSSHKKSHKTKVQAWESLDTHKNKIKKEKNIKKDKKINKGKKNKNKKDKMKNMQIDSMDTNQVEDVNIPKNTKKKKSSKDKSKVIKKNISLDPQESKPLQMEENDQIENISSDQFLKNCLKDELMPFVDDHTDSVLNLEHTMDQNSSISLSGKKRKNESECKSSKRSKKSKIEDSNEISEKMEIYTTEVVKSTNVQKISKDEDEDSFEDEKDISSSKENVSSKNIQISDMKNTIQKTPERQKVSFNKSTPKRKAFKPPMNMSDLQRKVTVKSTTKVNTVLNSSD